MKTIIILILFFSTAIIGNAQTKFITEGKIEYEKKLNLLKENEGSSIISLLKDKMPKFRTTYHDLYFKDGKTLFEKGKDAEKIAFFGEDPSAEDVIYTDLNQSTFIKKQAVFDETFLISDSIRTANWRITNETMDIAGFECRKAVSIILDSVYVIAFYTDQIITSGGPMSYANLPGMILGIAIPRLNLTIFATKLELLSVPSGKLAAPNNTRWKKADYKTLYQTIQKFWSDRGANTSAQKNIINSLL